MFGRSSFKIIILCCYFTVSGCTVEREYSPIPHDRNDYVAQSDINDHGPPVISDPPEVFVIQDIHKPDPFEGM